jgi:hypothetical protein
MDASKIIRSTPTIERRHSSVEHRQEALAARLAKGVNREGSQLLQERKERELARRSPAIARYLETTKQVSLTEMI